MNLISTLKNSFLPTLLAGLSGLAAGYWLGLNKVCLPDIFSLYRSGSEPSSKESVACKSDESLHSKTLQRRQILMSLEKAFRVSKSDLEAICVAFIGELELGLERSRCELRSEEPYLPASTLPMLPSYVDRLPTGNESGVFLAVDFGGTHVRIIKVIVDENPIVVEKKAGSSSSSNLPSKFRLIQSKMIVPDELKHGSGYDLFDYIADGVVAFLKQHPVAHQLPKTHAAIKQHRRADSAGSSKLKYLATDLPPGPDADTSQELLSVPIPLGFTFSFAVKQNAIDSGTIISWNKDFKCDDVVGCDPVRLLQNALKNKGIHHVKVAALVNDTVGTLVAHAYEHPQTMIGLILGTGANSCYIEKIERIKKFNAPGSSAAQSTHMLMNTEFGAFNPDFDASCTATAGRKRVLPRTRFDEAVDAASRNPGCQVYEKMISGHYLGEIVRTVLMELVETGKIFADATWKGASSTEDKYGILSKRHSFDTSYMSRIERDHSSELADTKSVFEDIFEIHDTSVSDRQLVKFVCELVAIRSARLAAATIAGIVSHLGLARLLYHIRAAKTASAPSTPVGAGAGSAAALYAAGSGALIRPPALLTQPSNDNVVVAIDGSLFEFYPHYGNRMMDSLRELFGSRADAIQLSLARDGSGLGAALIAAIASDRSDQDEGALSTENLASYLQQSTSLQKTLAC